MRPALSINTLSIRTLRLLAVAGVSACAGINLAVLLWMLTARPQLNADFRGPWSFARFARGHAAQLYQAARLQAFQHRIYPGFHSFFPYQYPPSFLLPSWWLGDLGYASAEAAWTLAGIAALVLAAALFFGRRGFPILALLASPAALLNLVQGETGFFTTSLLLAGFALLPARPALAGLAFGVLSVKPQLGMLIPFALLARRDWRAVAAATLTAFALIALSCLLFPAALWPDWLRSLPVYQAEYLRAGRTLDLQAMVTLTGNLILLGAPLRLAWGAQAACGLASAAAVFLLFRQGPYRLAVAGLFAGMFLVTPHAYVYDTLPLIVAMLLLAPASPAGMLLCLVAYLAPDLLLTGGRRAFLYIIPETLLFVSVICLAIGAVPRPDRRHEPVSSGKPCPHAF